MASFFLKLLRWFAYAPTNEAQDEVNDVFYDQLASAVSDPFFSGQYCTRLLDSFVHSRCSSTNRHDSVRWRWSLGDLVCWAGLCFLFFFLLTSFAIIGSIDFTPVSTIINSLCISVGDQRLIRSMALFFSSGISKNRVRREILSFDKRVRTPFVKTT